MIITLIIAVAFLVYYLVYLRPRPEHWKLLDPIVEDVDMSYAAGGTDDAAASVAT